MSASIPATIARRLLRSSPRHFSASNFPRAFHSTSIVVRQSRKSSKSNASNSSKNASSSSSTIPTPSSSALSALLARLSLPISSDLHESLIACLTHPSFYIPDSPESTCSVPTEEQQTNELLSSVGNALLGLFASEHLSLLYPHLPSTALKVAVTSLVGPSACVSVARELGVGVIGGGSVEGIAPGKGTQVGGVPIRWKRRFDLVAASDVWDAVDGEGTSEAVENVRRDKDRQKKKASWEEGVASVTRAFVGLIYQEKGIHAARRFVSAHFFSRHLDPAALFNFKNPRHILSSVVAKHLVGAGVDPSEAGRIDARLLASSGVQTQAPLFSIGLFLPNGLKLAEGSGSSISMAYHRAATNALHSIFLVRSDSHGFHQSLSPSTSTSLSTSPSTLASTSSSTLASSATSFTNSSLPTEAHGEYLIQEGKVVPSETTYQGVTWGGDEGIVGLAKALR